MPQYPIQKRLSVSYPILSKSVDIRISDYPIGTLDISTNDVANSFATSVSSRSITYIQAMRIATVTEFGGRLAGVSLEIKIRRLAMCSIGVSARVAETIRTKVINVALFEDDPAPLMLGVRFVLPSPGRGHKAWSADSLAGWDIGILRPLCKSA
jgi:hypothetical protein